MFNVKSVLAIAFVSVLAVSAAQADELSQIDVSDLHATLNAELTDNMNQMQQELAKDVNRDVASENDEEVQTATTLIAD
ncbi:hypothetical protein [Shewanella gaetbuli]|uniref:Uncharacterized protein n=1 Tax=Shewanella gaetbuli TaxID=220752 RepID=A0A9X1ZKS8_9GAMM|nr:hypothetical protein [Shewanella gaetbuli]MCL1141637.1 hypothetical protein [Shewanella gaetbuli]